MMMTCFHDPLLHLPPPRPFHLKPNHLQLLQSSQRTCRRTLAVMRRHLCRRNLPRRPLDASQKFQEVSFSLAAADLFLLRAADDTEDMTRRI